MRQHTEHSAPARREFLKLAVASTAVASVSPFLGASPALAQSDTAAKVTQQDVDKVLAGWPEKPHELAKKLISQYGLPQEATATHLVWHHNGPWKMSILYREEVPHNFPMPHTDMLEQVINFRVPAKKFDDLAAYDGSVTVRRTKGELAAMCDKEAMNFLALNLAHDIITGKKSVEEARQAYARDAKAFMQGQKPSYTQQLRFEVAQRDTGDPDKRIV